MNGAHDTPGSSSHQPQVAKDDIELLTQQFDLDKKKAERCLREAKGDVRAAMHELLRV